MISVVTTKPRPSEGCPDPSHGTGLASEHTGLGIRTGLDLELHFWNNYLENFGSKLDYEGSPGFRVNARFLLTPENSRQTWSLPLCYDKCEN